MVAKILGSSSSIEEVRRLISRVAGTEVRVLILGENGTGKELVAEAIHASSLRKDKPFVKLNCAAIPRELIESELFGHERGAFTGAVERKVGRFEQANGGTIFLDEVGDMPPEMQAKLLRVLETGTFERVGGRVTLHVDVRVVSATNKDLRSEVAAKHFREDLYHRVAGLPIVSPALRDRITDVPILARAFLAQLAPSKSLAESGAQALMRHDYPGNVRELHNVVERVTIMSDEQVIDERVALAAIAMDRVAYVANVEPTETERLCAHIARLVDVIEPLLRSHLRARESPATVGGDVLEVQQGVGDSGLQYEVIDDAKPKMESGAHVWHVDGRSANVVQVIDDLAQVMLRSNSGGLTSEEDLWSVTADIERWTVMQS